LARRLGRDRAQLWEDWRKQKHVETIAERKRLRRLFKADRRAGVLTDRTTGQLAEATTPPAPPARQTTAAEMFQRLWDKAVADGDEAALERLRAWRH
jgi:hypothetical protein